MDKKPTYEELVKTVNALEQEAVYFRTADKERGSSAEEWHTVFDAISDSVCMIDTDGIISRCNRAMTALLGKPFNEVFGYPCWQLVHGTSGPIEGCPIVRMRETRSRESMVLKIKGRYFNVVADPIFDGQGNIAGAVHIISDINEFKQTEEALRKSEEKYKSLVDMSPDPIVIIQDFRYQLVNPAFTELFGYTCDEAVGGLNPLSLVQESERGTARERMEARSRGEVIVSRQYSVDLLTKGGQLVHCECATASIEYNDRMASLTIIRDISERKRSENALKESEDRLREAQKIGKMGHWEFDLTSRKTTWSDQMYELFEAEPGQRIPDFVENLPQYYPEDFEEIQKDVLHAIETGQGFKMDYYVKLTSGRSAYHCSTFHPIKDQNGSVTKIRGTVQDITERKMAEKERERLINDLQNALDNLKTLTGLLPICAKCKKIRDDKGSWNQLEGYIERHSDALFSHSLCPECMDKLYGHENWYKG